MSRIAAAAKVRAAIAAAKRAERAHKIEIAECKHCSSPAAVKRYGVSRLCKKHLRMDAERNRNRKRT